MLPAVNKIFFFTDYERFRKQQGTVTNLNTVPTVVEREGDFRAMRSIYDSASVPATPSDYTRREFPGQPVRLGDFASDSSLSAADRAGHEQPVHKSRIGVYSLAIGSKNGNPADRL
jgi:hypothetical protein